MEYRFMNQKDRNKSVMGENGYEYKKAKGKFPKVKAKGKHSNLSNTDSEGFYLPKRMYPCKPTGILCDIFGDTPDNRIHDAFLTMDYLAKQVYEDEIDEMMCLNRLKELRTIMRFAKEDARQPQECSDESGKADKPGKAAESEAKCKAIMDGITWRYDWIQLNKKDCYLFAEYTAERLLGKHDPVKYLKEMPQDVRLQVLGLGRYYDEKKHRLVLGDEKENVSRDVLANANTYWMLLNRRYENEKFRMEFIRKACEMPEANRRTIDEMYETAWDIVLIFAFGMKPGKIPAPWYESLPSEESPTSEDTDSDGTNETMDTEGSTE